MCESDTSAVMNRTVLDLLDSNKSHAEAYADRFDDVQDGQLPDAVSVCCSDSRVLQDRMWENDEPGHLFAVGNIGNRVVQRRDGEFVVSGDVLYPLAHTETDTAVVVGHTGCGAVTATHDSLTEGLDEPPGIDYCLDLLRPHLEPGLEALPDGLGRADAINHLVEYNVDRQVGQLLESDHVPPTVDVVGAVYDFQDIYGGTRGEVHVVNLNGERDVGTLRAAHPEIESRIRRLWEY
jgi:carbonic anhydrase